MRVPLLVVLAGRPGTGKTTLASRLAIAVDATYLRIDVIETAVVRCGTAAPPVGVVGYVVAREIAMSNLVLGNAVIVDAVNPVAEARQTWPTLAAETGAQLVVFETVLADDDEHRRRVIARQPDLVAQSVPTWAQVEASDYEPWNERRDGPRVRIDMADTEHAVSAALSHLGR